MEFNKMESVAVAELATQADEAHTIELGELQLALIGGGVGEINLT